MGMDISALWRQQERAVFRGLCDVGSKNGTLGSETL